MKILIISQRYWPENFRINDIAETLVKEGHKVTVLTGLPNYPKGKIFNDYRNKKNRIEKHNGVNIVRAREIARHHNIIFRIFNYYSFSFFGSKKAKKLPFDFDVVLLNELSPIMGCNPGLAYAKKYHKRVVMYEMDLWPESLTSGGIRKNSFVYNHYKKVSSKIYSKCDHILVSSPKHIQYIKALPNCSDTSISYLPQYSEDFFLEIKDLPCKTPHFVFAGNVGKAQNLKLFLQAVKEINAQEKFVVDIVGSGSELNNLKVYCEQEKVDNVIFHGQKPLDEMKEFYSKASFMVVSLSDSEYTNLTIPGKIQSYMAADKPILCIAGGSTAELVKDSNSGIVVDSFKVDDVVATIKKCLEINRTTLVKNGRKYYLDNFAKENFFNTLMSKFK